MSFPNAIMSFNVGFKVHYFCFSVAQQRTFEVHSIVQYLTWTNLKCICVTFSFGQHNGEKTRKRDIGDTIFPGWVPTQDFIVKPSITAPRGHPFVKNKG